MEARALLTDIAQEVVGPTTTTTAEYDFTLLQKILSKFGQRLGALEDTECKVMKTRLTELEDEEGSGTVRLGDFYGDKGEYHFTESPNYLRTLGVLDETKPDDPKVLISNYLANPSNCVQPAGYYSICCFDECESLMDQVEKSLAAPMGTAEQIAKVASGLGSASKAANETLSSRQLSLLEDVAAHHGGMVPIHGRLFAQWMHEAYPRECSYPSLAAGRPEGDMEHVDASDKEKYAEIAKEQKEKGTTTTSTSTTSTKWVMKEELVDQKAFEVHVKSTLRSDITIFSALGFMGMACAKLLVGPRLDKKKFI